MHPTPASERQGHQLAILIADDHPVVREGLSALINTHPGMRVVAQASSGREALDMARRHAPDLVVLDVSMPEMNGIDTAACLLEAHPKLRILALTRHSEPGYLHEMLRAGAHGYLLKRAAAESLLAAIQSIANGGTFIDVELRPYLLESRSRASRGSSSHDLLTPREIEVLTLVAWGYTNAEIADRLDISIKTVESYKADGMARLKLRSRADLVRYASVVGWLSSDTPPPTGLDQ